MSGNRFDLLLMCLHFEDNENPRAKTDRLFKIKRIIDNFRKTLVQEENIVIDEHMVPWKGVSNFQQKLINMV